MTCFDSGSYGFYEGLKLDWFEFQYHIIFLTFCNSIMSLCLWLANASNILQWLWLTNRDNTWHLLCTISSCIVQEPAELLAVSCDLRSSRLLSPTSAASVPRATSEACGYCIYFYEVQRKIVVHRKIISKISSEPPISLHVFVTT